MFTFFTVFANWYRWTGDESLGAFIPPFVSGFNMGGQSDLGGEYYNIAAAIYGGRGFSDPFGTPTGPTGWSPPLLTYLLAGGLHLAGGSKAKLVVGFFAMQVVVLALTVTVLLFIADEGKRRGTTALAVLAAAAVIAPNFRWMFQQTHDGVFQMLWVDLIVIGLWGWRAPPRSSWRLLGWGAFGGVCALSSPVVGFTWACATTGTWRLKNWRAIALAAAASIVIVAPWVAVQSLRLGTFVPIKSNASFEKFQGQLVLPDGLVVESSYSVHPYRPNSAEWRRYSSMGEVRYLEEKEEQFRASVSGDPWEFMRKTARRALAATVWLDTDIPAFEARRGFGVLRVLAVLPFLGLLTLLCSRLARARWASPAIQCYGCYLVPYILIGYYERYAIPLALPKMMFVLWLLAFAKERWRARTPSNESDVALAEPRRMLARHLRP